jgi:hypothetical protein
MIELKISFCEMVNGVAKNWKYSTICFHDISDLCDITYDRLVQDSERLALQMYAYPRSEYVVWLINNSNGCCIFGKPGKQISIKDARSIEKNGCCAWIQKKIFFTYENRLNSM